MTFNCYAIVYDVENDGLSAYHGPKEQVWDRDGGLTAVCTIVLVPEALAAPSTSHIEYVSPLSRLLLFNGSDVFPRTPPSHAHSKCAVRFEGETSERL